jgi:hypothetical protein
MNRPQRIRLVVAAFLGLFWLFVAFIGAPIIAAAFWPSFENSNNVEQLGEVMAASTRIAEISGYVSLVAFLLAGLCFCYVMFIVAAWFIGPNKG